jgi:hypothetical protein
MPTYQHYYNPVAAADPTHSHPEAPIPTRISIPAPDAPTVLSPLSDPAGNLHPALGSPDRFAIVALYEHQPAPDNTIITGSYGMVAEFMNVARASQNALDRMAKADAARADLAEREERVRLDELKVAMAKMDRVIERLEANEAQVAAKRKADAEAERAQATLDAGPDRRLQAR